jgi:hypothetical protein
MNIIKILKKTVHNFFFQLEFNSYIKKSKDNKFLIEKKEFFFVLDLSSFIPNFDVTKNLIYLAIKSKYKSVHIVIIPELENASKIFQKEKKIEDPNYFRRINIVYPLIKMVDGFSPNIYFPGSRDEAYDLIKNKNITKLTNPFKGIERKFIKESVLFRYFKKKNFMPKYKANLTNLTFVKKKIKYDLNEKYISISLRNSSYNKNLNSNNKEWMKVAKYLKNNDYKVIIIRDFEDYFEPIDQDFLFYDQAIFDPQIRMAIYTLCILNLGVCNGPFNSFIFYSDCNFLCFKSQIIKREDYYRRYGFSDTSKDLQLPFFSSKQKIIYREDNYQDIMDELNIFFKENNQNIIL